MNLYDKDRDLIALGKFYTDHVSAMTREGLHAKSDIAAELAYRDRRISTLEAEKAVNDAFRKEAAKLADDYLSLNSAHVALAAKLDEYEQAQTVAWQWCESGHFRKALPKRAEAMLWRELIARPTKED